MRFFSLPLLLLAALCLSIQVFSQDTTAARKKKLTKQQQLQALKAPQTAIVNINEGGSKADDIVAPPPADIFERKKDTIEKVDQPATFPTDNAGWQAFLGKLITDSVYSDTTLPIGQYRTTLEIFIGSDGVINQVVPLQYLGHGIDERLIHGIMRSAPWKPALSQHGQPMASVIKQAISFAVQ